MKVKTQVILFLAGTLLAIFFIQTSSIFGEGQECYCTDFSDADATCVEWCEMGQSECDFATLQSYKGECSGEDCWQKWKLYCSDRSTAYYWQRNSYCWYCWLI